MKHLELLKRFSYNPETGVIYRTIDGLTEPAPLMPWAGGYKAIYVAPGRKLLAHRAAWCLHHGEWPKGEIDHINGDKDDHRLVNLRLTTRTQNIWNRGARSTNKSGHVGVSFQKARNRWLAQINIDGKHHYLGRFKTAEEAAEAYRAASIKLHGEFSPFVSGVA